MLTLLAHAGDHPRHDAIAELRLPPGVHAGHMLELDANDAPLDAPVPWQCDADPDDASHRLLTFMLTGHTPAHTRRRYRVLPTADASAAEPPPLVTVDDDVPHQGQASLRITTAHGVWLYHKAGAGFASLFDRHGRDWISYRPTGGAAGHYRGIPNLVHPESYFHPGNTDCLSHLVTAGPLRAAIASRSGDGQWATRWDIFPAHARLTVLEAPRPWWFLYEGTPAGALDEAGQRVLRSTGELTSAGEKWATSLPHPAWVAFIDPRAEHSLYLARHPRHANPEPVTDSYWPMEQAMTVFGFGRDGLEKSHQQVPAQFSVGLIAASEPEPIEAAAVACLAPVTATIA